MTISGFLLGILYSFLPNAFHHVGDLKDLLAAGEANSMMALGTFVILFFSTGLAAQKCHRTCCRKHEQRSVTRLAAKN